MRVPDEVRQCAVFIGLPRTLDSGQQVLAFVGTAFFVFVPSEIEGTSYGYLVTAKHVASKMDGQPFLIRVNTKDGKSMLISGKGAHWWTHPTDNSVDVTVIPWIPPENVEYKAVTTSMFLTDAVVKEKSIGSGDEVFITGLFAHLSGSKRNLPIVRMGNIAMMPSEPVSTSAGEIEAYLIEARSIGGLSGSPVFVRETVRLGLGSFYLLGLMHGHWDLAPSAKNDAILMDEDTVGRVNMGIAIVIPAQKIMEVLNHPELVEIRRKNDEKMRKARLPTPDKESSGDTQVR
jgi:hypothetical protein